jgi:hypothetical protein
VPDPGDVGREAFLPRAEFECREDAVRVILDHVSSVGLLPTCRPLGRKLEIGGVFEERTAHSSEHPKVVDLLRRPQD